MSCPGFLNFLKALQLLSIQFICLLFDDEEESHIREALLYEKGTIVPFGQPTHPPKWLKSGHLLSDYVHKWDSQHFNVEIGACIRVA